MFQGANCSGLQTQGVILSRGGGGWGQALGRSNKVLLSLLPPTSFTCKSVCAHKSQLSRARNLPIPRAAVSAAAARTAERGSAAVAAAGAAWAGRRVSPGRRKASRGGFGLCEPWWWLCMPFLFLNSIALMEANRREGSLRPVPHAGVGRDAQPASLGRGGHAGRLRGRRCCRCPGPAPLPGEPGRCSSAFW